MREGELIGTLFLLRSEQRPFSDKQIKLVETFADQAVIAIENTRLFEEVQARTRELAKTVEDLEIASQHKNQFVVNMSHELRTPLCSPGFTAKPKGDIIGHMTQRPPMILALVDTITDSFGATYAIQRQSLGECTTIYKVMKPEREPQVGSKLRWVS